MGSSVKAILQLYIRIGCVRNEDACCLLLDRLQRMIVIDLFREEFAFREGNLANERIVGLADCLAHIRRSEDRPILVEEALVVSEMIWVDCDGYVSRSSSMLKS